MTSHASVGRRVKILYLLDALEGGERTGGTEAQFRELLRHLDRNRFEPHVALFRPTLATRDTTALGCPARVLGIEKLRAPRTLLKLSALTAFLRGGRFDLVHIFFNDAAIAAPAFCRLGGARVIASRRDMGFWYTDAQLRALRMSNRFVSRMVVNSEAVKRHVHEREGYPLDRIDLVYNGHRPVRFDVAPLEGLREGCGIGATDPIVGIVANLNPWKRHIDLLHAFAIVKRRHPAAHLVLVGDGPLQTSLRQAARDLNLESSVHFLGPMADVVPVVQHFTIGVLCSESEGLSNAVIEYMWLGKPSVCTDVGGNPEIVRDGDTGFLVKPFDVPSLADRIDRLLAEPTTRTVMGGRARTVAQRLTTRRMTELHMDVYERLAGCASWPASAKPATRTGY